MEEWQLSKDVKEEKVILYREDSPTSESYEIVGDVVEEKYFFGLKKRNIHCSFCETPMRRVERITIYTRIGKDGNQYQRKEQYFTTDIVCPNCNNTMSYFPRIMYDYL